MRFLARTALFLALVIGIHALAYALVPDTATGGLNAAFPAYQTNPLMHPIDSPFHRPLLANLPLPYRYHWSSRTP